MSLRQKSLTIGKESFVLEQLPTTKGLEVTFAIGQIIKGMAEGVSDEFVLNFDATKVNAGKMIAGVIANTDVKETPEFIKQLICDSVKSPDFGSDAELYETYFAGKYELINDVLTEIIVFNKFHDLVKKNLFQLMALLQESE